MDKARDNDSSDDMSILEYMIIAVIVFFAVLIFWAGRVNE